jgi:hypothetical protein
MNIFTKQPRKLGLEARLRSQPTNFSGEEALKKASAAVAFTVFFVTIAFAADTNINPNDHGKNFEQRKAEILTHIEHKIVRAQEEKACVKSAKSHDELKACWKKSRPEPPKGDRPRHREY